MKDSKKILWVLTKPGISKEDLSFLQGVDSENIAYSDLQPGDIILDTRENIVPLIIWMEDQYIDAFHGEFFLHYNNRLQSVSIVSQKLPPKPLAKHCVIIQVWPQDQYSKVINPTESN